MIKIKVNDTVKVMSGKDKGRDGKIEKILPKKQLIVVPGINIYKKHVKGQQGQKGGIYDIPRPLPISKVSLICPKCKKTARIGIKIIDNSKVRICVKCGKQIDTK